MNRAVAPLLALAVLLVLPASPAVAVSPWGAVHVVASGAAGEWILAYQPLPEPVTGLNFNIKLDFTATGAAGSPVVALLEATPVFSDDAGARIDNPFTGPALRAASGTLTVHSSTGAAQFGPPIPGVLVVASASAPWTLDVTITIDDTLPTVGPSFVSRGTGAVFSGDAMFPGGVPTPAVGLASLSATYDSPGWTHIQVAAHHLQPDGVRDFNLAWPNGVAIAGIGLAFGANAVLIGTWTENAYWGGYGTQQDTPGTFTGSVLYAAVSDTPASFLLGHLPLGPADYPPGFQLLSEYGANEVL